MDAQLRKALVAKLAHHRSTAPVYQLRERRVDEIEADAHAFARRFARSYLSHEPRPNVRTSKETTTLLLPEGARVVAFHASGAMFAARGLAPFEQLISDTDDQKELTARSMAALKRLELEALAGHPAGERLELERLWRIKASGMARHGARSSVALCRVVAAFRRFVSDLPVLGRASVFVKLAGEDVIDAAGVDWRPTTGKPIAQAKIIDAETAADRILRELSLGAPGDLLSHRHLEPQLFALAYCSLPKRQVQAFLQPVYVAALRPCGPFATLGRVAMVPATEHIYEPLGRPIAAPPRLAAKPRRQHTAAAH